ncbi:MAG: MgtC/SapB family protein [Rikenellaceae bacterium]|nr:MgtC/SapB family protein [Rikenellaceae bacterium]
MMMDWSLILRLTVACVLATIVGYDREYRAKDAGLKTHFLVALGSALFMIISRYGFGDSTQVDFSRVAAQVVSGIGFIGAGTIIFQKQIVRGLTTAASLWATSGIGMAAGAGLYAIAAAATLLTMIGLEAFGYIFKKFGARRIYISILVNDKQTAQSVYFDLKKVGYQILSYDLSRLDKADGYRVAIVVRSLVGNDEEGFIEVLHTNPDITVEQVE